MNICCFSLEIFPVICVVWSSIFNSNVLEHLGTVVLFWSFLRKVDCNFGIHGSCYSITQFHSSQLHPVRCYPCLPAFFSHQSRWQLSQDEKFTNEAMGENWTYVSIIFFVFLHMFFNAARLPRCESLLFLVQDASNMHLYCDIQLTEKNTWKTRFCWKLESSKYLGREFPCLSGYTAQGRLNSQRLPDVQFQELFSI